MTEPRKLSPTPAPGEYKALLPGDDTPPQGSRRHHHGTPAAGIEVPRSRPAGVERPASVREPPDLRGLGSDKDLPKRSELYAEVIKLAPDDKARWHANVEWMGKALDGQDALVTAMGHVREAQLALDSAVEGMRLAVGLELGVNGGKVAALAGADAQAVDRVVQLEGALHAANSKIAQHEQKLTAKQAAVGGGVGTILTIIISLIMHLSGHWK